MSVLHHLNLGLSQNSWTYLPTYVFQHHFPGKVGDHLTKYQIKLFRSLIHSFNKLVRNYMLEKKRLSIHSPLYL